VFGDDPFITRQFAQIHDSSMLGPTAPDTLFTKSARIARYTPSQTTTAEYFYNTPTPW
jgi:hypothetical protein